MGTLHGIFSSTATAKSTARRFSLGLLGFLGAGMLLSACGGQDPSFKEDRSVAPSSFDAKGISGAQGDGDIQNAEASAASNGVEGHGGILNSDSTAAGNDGMGGAGTGGSGTGGSGTGTTGTGAGGAGGSGTGTTGSGSGTGTGTGGSGTGTGGTDGGSGTGGGGTGTGGTEGTGQFELITQDLVQPSAGKVDILWIVDTSGSMSEEQAYLGTNFGSFINQLTLTGADFQTAVSTTDICQDTLPNLLSDRVCPVNGGGSAATHLRGSFVGTAGNKVLKKGDANLATNFLNYTNVGINGSGFEHGLKGAEMAIAKSLSGENEALVRSDAFLAVIVVSDEEDDSIGLGMNDAYSGQNYVQLGLTTFQYTHNDFVNYLKTVKAQGKFSVSAITGTKDANGAMCTSPHSMPAEAGTQYIAAAQATGGIVQSICETNWSNSLALIGQDLAAQQSQINLSGIADVATIKIWVNGVLTTAWTYNSGNNAVKFNANAVPAPGAQIRIQYFKKI